ncbi:cell division control protein 48 homolog B isoform X2, partial [Tanacetum coccineum]
YAIDAALMRPGRFDQVLYVPPPDEEARYEILRVHTRGMTIDDDVDLRQIAQETDRFTGAELEGLCREAGIVALRENITATIVHSRHFQTVKSSLKPALTSQEIDSYASFMKNPRRKPPHQLGKQTPEQTKNWSSGLVVPVIIGVVGFIVIAGTRDYIMHYLQNPVSGRLITESLGRDPYQAIMANVGSPSFPSHAHYKELVDVFCFTAVSSLNSAF